MHVGNKNLNRCELPVDLTVFPNRLHTKVKVKVKLQRL